MWSVVQFFYLFICCTHAVIGNNDSAKVWFAYPMSYPLFVITSEYGKLAANLDTAQVELIPWIPVAALIAILCLGISCLRFGQAERR